MFAGIAVFLCSVAVDDHVGVTYDIDADVRETTP